MATPTALPASFSSGNALPASDLNLLRGAFRTLQVRSNSYSSQTGNSGGYAATGLEHTITPQYTSSSVLITATIVGSTSGSGMTLGLRLVRRIGATDTTIQTWTYAIYNSAGSTYAIVPISVLETPSTTSTCTYRIEFAITGGSGTVYTQVGNTPSNIILQEVSG